MREELPPVGIGTYDLSPQACEDAVRTALEAGYRHVDTAEMYENERAVGAALDASTVDRESVFVSTKIDSRNLAYDDVIEHANASADRLGIDTIDLLYVHWPIRTYDPAETLAAFDDLSESGLVRHVGLSNFTPDRLDVALDALDAPLFAHQVECHPLLPQEELRRYAREHDHHLVAYSPLAKGNVTEHPVLVDIASQYDATPAQIALAWLLSNESVSVIPKSTSQAHIEENLAARELSLEAADIERIDNIEDRARQVDFPAAPWNSTD